MKIEETKPLGFKTLSIILDDETAREAADKRGYGMISVLTHSKLDLPGFRLAQSKETGLIELNKSDEEILAGFSSTARNEIRRSLKDTTVTFRVLPHITDEAYALYRDFEKHTKRVPYPRGNFSQCWEVSAHREGAVVSVVWVYASAPVARLRHLFSIRHTDKAITFTNRRIVYEAARECKKRGCTALDLAGIVPNSQDFKWSFRPVVVQDYTYVRVSPLYGVLRTIMSIIRRFQERGHTSRVILRNQSAPETGL